MQLNRSFLPTIVGFLFGFMTIFFAGSSSIFSFSSVVVYSPLWFIIFSIFAIGVGLSITLMLWYKTGQGKIGWCRSIAFLTGTFIGILTSLFVFQAYYK